PVLLTTAHSRKGQGHRPILSLSCLRRSDFPQPVLIAIEASDGRMTTRQMNTPMTLRTNSKSAERRDMRHRQHKRPLCNGQNSRFVGPTQRHLSEQTVSSTFAEYSRQLHVGRFLRHDETLVIAT